MDHDDCRRREQDSAMDLDAMQFYPQYGPAIF
jgi:hypothetical protein